MHKTITKFLKIYIKKILKYYFLINNFSVSFFLLPVIVHIIIYCILYSANLKRKIP